jgi:hypothetical protein
MNLPKLLSIMKRNLEHAIQLHKTLIDEITQIHDYDIASTRMKQRQRLEDWIWATMNYINHRITRLISS